MALTTLSDLFVHFLRDIYYAEKKALKEMRGMSRKASLPALKELIDEHREETEGQIEALEQVFETLGLRARGVKCEAIDGIASEAHEIMEEAEDGRTRDCGIVAAAQAVEHYEITRYGTLIAWARSLGHDAVIPHLEGILAQEKAADEKLSQLAEATLNRAAEAGEVEDAEDGAADEPNIADDVEEINEDELDDEGKAAKAELLAMDEEIDDAAVDHDEADEGHAAKSKTSAPSPNKKKNSGGRGRKAA